MKRGSEFPPKEPPQMNQGLLLGLLLAIVGILVVAVITLATRRRGPAQNELSSLRQEMQAALSAQAQSLGNQLNQAMSNVTQQVTQQLGQVSDSLQKGLASSGMLASQAQQAVASELKNS